MGLRPVAWVLLGCWGHAAAPHPRCLDPEGAHPYTPSGSLGLALTGECTRGQSSQKGLVRRLPSVAGSGRAGEEMPTLGEGCLAWCRNGDGDGHSGVHGGRRY